MANNIILRDSLNVNHYQAIIKREFNRNVNDYKQKKLDKENEAREALRKQLS
tara:strand:+ start:482 stop:637 length:156 start_codon:yes stop_codon:yes gene_type:complete